LLTCPLQRAEAAAPQIQKLNPRVKLHVDTSDIRQKGHEFYGAFDLVIATDLDFPSSSLLNAACRLANNRPFYAAGAHGFYGYIFVDLASHEYIIERVKPNIPTKLGKETITREIIATQTKKENGQIMETVTKRELYSPLILANSSPLPTSIRNVRRRLRQVTPLLSCLRALWDFQKMHNHTPQHNRADLVAFTELATQKHSELQLPPETLKSEFLRKFLQNLGSELAPVTAILGGLLAQDVINVLGKREQPIQNLCLFDGEEYNVPVYSLYGAFDDDENAANGVNGLGTNGLSVVPTRVQNGSAEAIML
jgi:ubiquitin-like 1-activating enzyme E1 A